MVRRDRVISVFIKIQETAPQLFPVLFKPFGENIHEKPGIVFFTVVVHQFANSIHHSLFENIPGHDIRKEFFYFPEIAMVKMADRICNLQEPPDHWFEDKIVEYYEEAKVIYQALKHVNPQLADRLKMKTDEYKKYFE